MYRKNPVHFREFSHDFSSTDVDTISSGDVGSDNDDTDKPECPYGADCYRYHQNGIPWNEKSKPVAGADLGIFMGGVYSTGRLQKGGPASPYMLM